MTTKIDFCKIDELLKILTRPDLNTLDYVNNCLSILTEYYVVLCTQTSEYKARENLYKTIKGRKTMDVSNEEYIDFYINMGKLEGYIKLIDKCVILTQQRIKILNENLKINAKTT